jgi:hypothetical protein
VIGTKTITKANGDVQTIVGDMIQHRRLLVDARKWALSKALPKIYGDKREVDNKHTIVERPIGSATAKLDKEGPSKGQGDRSQRYEALSLWRRRHHRQNTGVFPLQAPSWTRPWGHVWVGGRPASLLVS